MPHTFFRIYIILSIIAVILYELDYFLGILSFKKIHKYHEQIFEIAEKNGKGEDFKKAIGGIEPDFEHNTGIAVIIGIILCLIPVINVLMIIPTVINLFEMFMTVRSVKRFTLFLEFFETLKEGLDDLDDEDNKDEENKERQE